MAMSGGKSRLVKTTNPFTDSSKEVKLYIYYKTSQNIASNTSTITCGMYVTTPSGWDIGAWSDFDGSYVGNSSNTFDGSIPNFSGTRWIVENKQFTVNHKSDGTGTATIRWKWGVRSSWGGYYEPSGSFMITLPTIPRASSITSASDVTLEDDCNIKWTPASSSFTYKLKFSLGNWSHTTGVISPETTSAYAYTGYKIPLEVAEKLPNATTGTMTVCLYTYNSSTQNSSTQIGSVSSKTFTITVPSTIIPTMLSVTTYLINDNSILQNQGIAVAGFTKVHIIAFASGSYGSTISSFVINGDYNTTQSGKTLDYIGGVIGSSGNKTFTVRAKDSRGRLSPPISSDSIFFYDYSVPEISYFKVSRTSGNNSLIQVRANWNWSSVDGNNGIVVKLYYKESSNDTWNYYGEIPKNTNYKLYSLTADEKTSYNFKIVATDHYSNSVQEEGFISTVSVTVDFRAGGKGIGIGKIAESDNLEIAFDTIFMGNVYIQLENGTKILLSDYIKSLI